MKRPILFLFALSIALYSSALFSQSTFVGDNSGATIDGSSPVESKASVNLTGNIGQDHVIDSLKVDITHPSVGELELKLISPQGVTLDLSLNNGGFSSNYTNTIFTDNANDITKASGPFTGYYQPEGGNFISNFNSSDVNGDWILIINDTNASFSDGTFNDFEITFSAAPSCPTPNDLSVSNITDTGAEISWIEEIPSSASDGYEWIFMNSGSTPNTANALQTGSVANGTFSDMISSLTSDQEYDIYIRSACDNSSNQVSDWSFNVRFKTACSPFNVPFIEDFESSSIGDPAPNCWSVINTGSGDNQVENFGGPTGNVYRLAPNSQPGEYLLISPFISQLTTNGLKVDFKARTNASSVIQIGTMSDFNNVNTFNTVDTKSISSSSFENFEANVVAGSDSYFAIRIAPGSVTSTGAIYFDDISFQDIPSCPKPSGLQVSGVSTNSADLSWNEEAPASATDGYEWVVMDSGNSPDTTTAVSTGVVANGTLSKTISNLTENQAYDIYVRSVCDSNSNELSNWSNAVSFTTACTASSIPFSEDFNSSPAGSQANPNAPNCWNFINSGPGATFVAGFGGLSNSQSYILGNGSDPTGDYVLVSPKIANISANGVQVSFSYRSSNQGNSIEIGTMGDFTDASSFNLVETKTTSSSNYENVEVNILSGGNDEYIAVRVASNNPSFISFNLDNFNFNDIPSCAKPENLQVSNISQVDAQISWEEEVPQTATNGYDYYITSNGTVPGSNTTPTGNVASGTTNKTISGLTSNTEYDVYVRSDCGGGDKSDWSNVKSFTTLCATFSTPFSENFSSSSSTENCWKVVDNNNDGDQWDLDYASNTLEGDEVASLLTDFNSGNNDDYLITPTIDLTGNEQLRFSYSVESSNEPNDFQVTLSTNGTDPPNFTNTLLSLNSYTNTTYKEKVIDLSSFTGNVNIAFHVPNGGLDGWRLYIDKVVVEEIPTCFAPDNLAVSNVTGTTAQLDWDSEATATSGYDYYVTTNGTVPDANTTPTGNVTSGTTTTTLSGLMTNTDHEVYLRSDCGGTDLSDWSSAISFSTFGDCSSTGSFDYTNNNDSSDSVGFIANTPGDNITLTFSAGQTESCCDTWFINDAADGTGNTIASGNGSIVGSYESTTGEISFYVDSDFSVQGTTFQYELSCAPPPCNTPTSLNVSNISANDADLSWNAEATATNGYDYFITSNGSVPDTNTTATGSVASGTSTVNVSNLMSNTDYDAYVRSDCGTNVSSDWTNVVSFTTFPSCPKPTNLSINNVTTTGADLNWDEETPSSASNGYEWVVMNTNDAPDTGNAVATGSVSSGDLTATVTGLSSNTNYDAYVRSDCGGEKSDWSNGASFSTDCLAKNAPYTNSFESFPEQMIDQEDCWKASLNNTFFAASGQQSPASTGPNSADDGSTYVYFDGSNSNTAELESPLIDLSALTDDAQLLFSYYMYGLNMGTLKVEVNNMDGSGYVEEFSISMQQQYQSSLPWIQQTVDLSAYSGIVRIRFVGVPGTGPDSDIAIDNVSIDNKICAKPNNLSVSNISDTSVDLNWQEESPVSASNGYEWLIMNDGDAPDIANAAASGTVSNGTLATTVTGIADNMSYQAYVRSDCGGGFESDWSDEVSFTTMPSCPSPANIEHENTTISSFDFSWVEETPSSASDGYEWVIMEDGTAPSIGNAVATGTVASGVFSATASGLDDNTIYDVYVRSICDANTNEVSNWEESGDYFETNLATNGVSVTSAGNVSFEGYGSSGVKEWLFTSSNGLPLEVEFSEDQSNTNCFNGGIIIGSALGSSDLLDTYALGGSPLYPDVDLAGISYTSNTGTLYIYYEPTSDCFGTGGLPELDFSVKVVKDYTYTSSSGFSPSNPGGVVSAGELTIESGTASIASATEFKSVTVKPDAVLDIDAILTADVTFESDASGIAQLAEIIDNLNNSNASGTSQFSSNSNQNIVGDVTVERYIPVATENTRAFRFLTSSVDSNKPIRANWQEGVNNTGTSFPADNENPNPGFGTHITGSTTGNNGFDASISGNPSMYTFDNSFTGNQSNAWNAIPNTNTRKLRSGEAYRIFIRGDRGYNLSSDPANPPNADVTLRAKGELRKGAATNDSLSTKQDYYSLVGNPYQAIVNMNDVSTTNLNTNYYWIWDPNLSIEGSKGAYAAVELPAGTTPSSSDASQFVQPGQAFFVQTLNDGPASITFDQADKAVNELPTDVFSDDENYQMDIKLYQQDQFADGQPEADALRISFSADNDNAITQNDAQKLGNPDENLARLQNGKYISIEKRQLPEDEETLGLFTSGYATDNYIFEIDLAQLPGNMTAYLVDEHEDEQIQLNNGINEIGFSVDQNIPESVATNRFSLKFKTGTLGNDEIAENKINVHPNPVPGESVDISSQGVFKDEVDVKLSDISGRILHQGTKDAENGNFSLKVGQYQAGVYILSISSENKTYQKRLIIK